MWQKHSWGVSVAILGPVSLEGPHVKGPPRSSALKLGGPSGRWGLPNAIPTVWTNVGGRVHISHLPACS